MGFDSFANSRAGISTALAVSRVLPPAVGHGIARVVARRLAADRSSEMVRQIRANQWVVSGKTLSAEELDEAVQEVLTNSGYALYDLYHPGRRAEAIVKGVRTDAVFERILTTPGPIVYAGCHLGNFDIAGQALAFSGWQAQVMTVPNPHGGYESQNAIREDSGLEVTPVCLESLRRASRRLADGGVVVTGLDRPIPEPEASLTFFGEPAPLPLLHARLAMRAKAPVVVVAAPRREDGTYQILASEPIEMQDKDATANAARVLAVAEEFIAAHSRQWVMPHAVWPHIEAP